MAKPYVTRTFEGKTWYLKKGYAPLASPGTSYYNLGLAVDIFSASQPDRLRWLMNNDAKFGFSWELIPAELWHVRYWAFDDIPQAVKDWIGNNPSLVYQDPEDAKSHDQNLGNH